MAKTYELVVYDDDGAGVTSAITEYDRVDGGQLSYVGRSWLDADETRVVLNYLTKPHLRQDIIRMEDALLLALDKVAPK
jgi:hypothetical protein